jgi:hypothetical protein
LRHLAVFAPGIVTGGQPSLRVFISIAVVGSLGRPLPCASEKAKKTQEKSAIELAGKVRH